jgi:undecaprenyl-diphosphatase
MEGVDWGAYYTFQVWRPLLPRLTGLMHAVRPLGGYVALGLMVAAAVLWLLAARRFRTALFLAVLVLVSAGLGELLKLAFRRDRPPDWEHTGGTLWSFPSAHAMVSVVTYGAVALLLARPYTGWRGRVLVVGAASLLVVLVGASELFLGAHFLSDVLAGWAGGLSLLLAGWALAWPPAHRHPA